MYAEPSSNNGAEPSSNNDVRRLATELYAEGRDYLLAIARANATGEADAEEALQEAFVSFIRHFDPARGAPPLAWLTLTLKRACWGKRRKAHLDRYAGQEAEPGGGELGFVLESVPSPITGPEELAIRRDGARRRLACLKPDQRTALILQAAGYSYTEIGARRGWSYTKVNRCVNEGRAALKTTSAG
jgi:DNA-directed RNA polymerase specialized sigma24 family protein